MIVSLPSQCFDTIFDMLPRQDLINLSQSCRMLNGLVNAKFYETIVYFPGYKTVKELGDKEYRVVINSEDQLKQFLNSLLTVNKEKKFQFINLSEENQIITEVGHVFDLNALGHQHQHGQQEEVYVPVDLKSYPKNVDDDHLQLFRGMERNKMGELRALSIVVTNEYTMEDFQIILDKIVSPEQLQELEIIVLDKGTPDFLIFKTLPFFLTSFQLQTLSIIYLNHFEDEKNNLRVMMICSLIQMQAKSLTNLMIYLDLKNLNLAQLTILQKNLFNNCTRGTDTIVTGVSDTKRAICERISFNCNLSSLEIDFVILKELNFFKNFISNSSIIILLFEEFLKIDEMFGKFLLFKFNSLLKKKNSKFEYRLDFGNKFLFTNFFLKPKLRNLGLKGIRKLEMFNIDFKIGTNNSGKSVKKVQQQQHGPTTSTMTSTTTPDQDIKLTNVYNYGCKLIDNFEADMEEINSIFE